MLTFGKIIIIIIGMFRDIEFNCFQKSKMADNEAKAKALVAEAQKKMSSSKGNVVL